MKKRLCTPLLKTFVIQMIFAVACVFPVYAENQLIEPKNGSLAAYEHAMWPANPLGIKRFQDGYEYVTADMTVNLNTVDGFHVSSGKITAYNETYQDKAPFSTPITLNDNEKGQHVSNKVVSDIPLVSLVNIRRQCKNRAIIIANRDDTDQPEEDIFEIVNTFDIAISSSAQPDGLLDKFRFLRDDENQFSHGQFTLTITCREFIAKATQVVMAEVTPRYWMYDCREKNEPLGPPLFVQGTGYAYIVMEGNGGERECVTQGSVTTEDRSSIVWKAEDGGSWNPGL